MGSYEFTPIGRVLLSEKGILLKVPVLNSSEGKTANVVVLSNNICCVKAYCSRSPSKSVIFIRASQAVCRSTSLMLGLKEATGPYWDGKPGTDETRKWLMIIPDNLDKAGIRAIRDVFREPRFLFSEISAIDAKELQDDIRLGPSRVKSEFLVFYRFCLT